MAELCEWCGRPELAGESFIDDQPTCWCGLCTDCKFMHDVGPPRAGQPRGQVRSTKDDFVHLVAWGDDAHCFPVCWPYANHEVPLPTTQEFRRTDDPANCIACIGR